MDDFEDKRVVKMRFGKLGAMNVRLYNKLGAFVVAAIIPPFDVPPDVLLWNSRVFHFEKKCCDDYDTSLTKTEPTWSRYVESFAFYVLREFEKKS